MGGDQGAGPSLGRSGPTCNAAVGPAASDRVDGAALAQGLAPLQHLSELLHAAACGLVGVCHPQTHGALVASVMQVQYRLRQQVGDLEAALALFEGGSQRFKAGIDAALRDGAAGYPEDGVRRLGYCAAHIDAMRKGAFGLRGELTAITEALDAALGAAAETYAPESDGWLEAVQAWCQRFEAAGGESSDVAADEGRQDASGLPVAKGASAGVSADGSAGAVTPGSGEPTGDGGAPVPAHVLTSGDGRGAAAGRAEVEYGAVLLADLQGLATATGTLAVQTAAARLLVDARVELTQLAGGLARLSAGALAIGEACARLADETLPAWLRSGMTDSTGPAPLANGWPVSIQALQRLREVLEIQRQQMGVRYAYSPTPDEGARAAVSWAQAQLGGKAPDGGASGSPASP